MGGLEGGDDPLGLGQGREGLQHLGVGRRKGTRRVRARRGRRARGRRRGSRARLRWRWPRGPGRPRPGGFRINVTLQSPDVRLDGLSIHMEWATTLSNVLTFSGFPIGLVAPFLAIWPLPLAERKAILNDFGPMILLIAISCAIFIPFAITSLQPISREKRKLMTQLRTDLEQCVKDSLERRWTNRYS